LNHRCKRLIMRGFQFVVFVVAVGAAGFFVATRHRRKRLPGDIISNVESSNVVVDKEILLPSPEQLHGFPDDDNLHASCHMSVLFPKTSCIDAKLEAEQLIQNNVDTGIGNEQFKGKMSIYDQGNNWIWTTRLTYNQKYTDDQLFVFNDNNDKNILSSSSSSSSLSSCLIEMRSRSQSRSVLDYGVNYCNMWNVVSRIYGFVSEDASPATNSATPVVISHCNQRNIPNDPRTTCARY